MCSGFCRFQHTAARRRLHVTRHKPTRHDTFQHTAARRRLHSSAENRRFYKKFQHTAARRRLLIAVVGGLWNVWAGFNTQPPEGGCAVSAASSASGRPFQHTAARRRLQVRMALLPLPLMFQHTAARRRLHGAQLGGAVAVMFQHTAARRRLRPRTIHYCGNRCFNTQPPEGGCAIDCMAGI